MSLKVDAYVSSNPAPKTVEKFLVRLPGITQAAFKVSSASLPYAQQTEGAISFLGRQFFLPTGKIQTGDWTCTYVEDLTMSGAMVISALERRLSTRWVYLGDIEIYILDQITGMIPQLAVNLKFAWLKSVKPKQLNWQGVTDVQAYELTFRYNAIKRWY